MERGTNGRSGAAHAAAPAVCFVIPARDAEATLAAVLTSVRRHAGALAPELVVVDDASRDGTARVAAEGGARVVAGPGTTPGAARNRGAQETRGPWLIFLDADVRLTPEWARHAPQALERLAREPRRVTGSRVEVPESPSWIERHWFAALPVAPGYVNSGHLWTSRALFEALGGFDASLASGEDVDFCGRARAAGAELAPDPRLRVLHDGFPRDLRSFFRRELWHGRGDARSWQAFRRSRPARLGVLVLALEAGVVLALVLGHTAAGLAAALALLAVAALATRRRFPTLRGPVAWGANLLLSWVYLTARGLAVLGAGRRRPARASSRSA